MKIVSFITAVLMLASISFAQTNNEKLKMLGRFYFDDSDERIVAYQLNENGELRLGGINSFQIWDTRSNRILEKKRHGIKGFKSSDGQTVLSPNLCFSPDLRRAVVLSSEYKERDAQGKKIKKYSLAEFWNVETGGKIKIFDDVAESVNNVLWNDDGTVLVVEHLAGGTFISMSLGDFEIAFRDGESGKLKAAISVKNLIWQYLTPDGKRFLTVSGLRKEFLGIDYASQKAPTIDVWNTETGKIEKSFDIGDDVYFSRTTKLKVSPDGKRLALVQKSRQSETEDRLLIFNLDEVADQPKFTIKAAPQITDSELTYTPDSRFVALDSDKNTQIYSLETGARVNEIDMVDPPALWLAANSIALYPNNAKLTGIRTDDGASLFEKPIVYKTTEVPNGTYTTTNGNRQENTTTTVVDYTRIAPHPNDVLFLEYSNKYASICDGRDGAILQSLIKPALIIKRNLKILGIKIGSYLDDGKNTISTGEWSDDGKFLMIRDYEGVSISVWEVNK